MQDNGGIRLYKQNNRNRQEGIKELVGSSSHYKPSEVVALITDDKKERSGSEERYADILIPSCIWA